MAIVFGIILTIALWLMLRDHDTIPAKNNRRLELKTLYQDLKKICKNKQIWINGLIGAALFTPTTIFAGMWAVPYLIHIKHLPETTAAIASSATFLGWVIGSPLMGIWSDSIQRRNLPLYVGSSLCVIVSLVLLYTNISNPYLIMLLMLLLGVFSSAEILVFAISHDITPLVFTGTGVALTNMLVMCGGFLQPLVGCLLKATAHLPMISQYHFALSIVPICFVSALIACFFLKETYCEPQKTL